jgi:hypothetical protein
LSIFLNVFPNKVWYCIGAVICIHDQRGHHGVA